ncbi:hypothetical protein, partial [Burkholderia ubonensis]|uniref:hypothetical protein n=1 Tax=Burkholderia ubonensis TaxID=101571 RepID=UPI001E40C6F5
PRIPRPRPDAVYTPSAIFDPRHKVPPKLFQLGKPSGTIGSTKVNSDTKFDEFRVLISSARFTRGDRENGPIPERLQIRSSRAIESEIEQEDGKGHENLCR